MPTMYCEFCNDEVDTKALGTYKMVQGWVKNRKQGGSNSVSMPSDMGAWAHGHCLDQERVDGSVSWGQEKMF